MLNDIGGGFSIFVFFLLKRKRKQQKDKKFAGMKLIQLAYMP